MSAHKSKAKLGSLVGQHPEPSPVAQQAVKASAPPETKQARQPKQPIRLVANPPRGERSDFMKIQVTMPPDLYTTVMAESARLRGLREKDSDFSSLVRKALVDWVEREVMKS